MDSERYDQSRLGRYGKNGFLFQIDQPTNPETGETTPFGPGIVEQGKPVPGYWNEHAPGEGKSSECLCPLPGFSVYFISQLQNLFSGPNTLSARPLQKGTLASSPLITLSRPMSARIRITRVTRAVMIPKIPDNTVPRKGIR